MLSISLQSIKQYHDEKFDKTNFIKNVVLDNILPGDIYAKARELHFVSDVQRVVLLIRVTSGNDISAYDVVSVFSRTNRRTSSLTSARPTPSWSRRSSPTTTPAIWKSWLLHRRYAAGRPLHQGRRRHRYAHRQHQGPGLQL